MPTNTGSAYRGDAGLDARLRRVEDDVRQLRERATRPQKIPTAVASSGEGGGIRRLTCVEFNSTDITTGSAEGNPYTLYRTSVWSAAADGALQPSAFTPAAPDVVVEEATEDGGFDTVEEGFYTLRYSIVAGFADDASCPDWLQFQANTFYNNRPHVGVEHMTIGNLTAAFPGSGLPGSSWDVTLERFYQPAWSAENGYSLGMRFLWPGITSSPMSWSIYADLARVG